MSTSEDTKSCSNFVRSCVLPEFLVRQAELLATHPKNDSYNGCGISTSSPKLGHLTHQDNFAVKLFRLYCYPFYVCMFSNLVVLHPFSTRDRSCFVVTNVSGYDKLIDS